MLELTEKIIKGIKNYFNVTKGKVAVIGISGGKDSSVSAALCVNALGKENVIGVLMPKGEQSDIEDSRKLCEILDIKNIEVNIGEVFGHYWNSLSENNIAVTERASINLQPRLRMSLLYFVAQCVDGGRVINTTNKCESFVGYGTLWGDTVGDFAPLADLLVSEVKTIGKDLGLPNKLVDKTPSDGLSGKSDEEKLGVSYDAIERFIKNDYNPGHGDYVNSEEFKTIINLYSNSEFKRNMIHIPTIKIRRK